VEKISSQFYVSALRALIATAPELRYWAICKLILQQAMQQLDPLRLGMGMVIALCTEPLSERKVRSLRTSMGRGTLPGVGDWERLSLFLGIESLSGYAITRGHPVTIQNLYEDHRYYPVRRLESVRSAIANPIRHADGIAGCLSIFSTQPYYFSPGRQKLVQNYADLLTLAFEPRAFYALERLELGVMPAQSLQASYFASFQQRLATTLQEAARLQLSITLQLATLKVWRQIEEELLGLACIVPAQLDAKER
jgi:GAF domain